MKYLDLINRTAEETAKTNNALIAKESSIALQAEVLSMEKEINSLTNRIDSAKCSKPLDIKALMTLQISLDIAQKKLSYLNNLTKELF